MLQAIRAAGGAYRLQQRLTSFQATLNDEQRAELASMKTDLMGMVGGFVPEELRPVISHVFADDGDPVLVKAIGAWMNPAVKQSVVNLLPMSEGVQHPMTIRCRFCGQFGQYGHDHNEEEEQ